MAGVIAVLLKALLTPLTFNPLLRPGVQIPIGSGNLWVLSGSLKSIVPDIAYFCAERGR